MSPARAEAALQRLRRCLPVFAALGDETRLTIVARLSGGAVLSITRLTERSKMTRQAVTKHLRILQDVGIVRSVRQGREVLFELEPDPLDAARVALERIGKQWEDALARLRAYVED